MFSWGSESADPEGCHFGLCPYANKNTGQVGIIKRDLTCTIGTALLGQHVREGRGPVAAGKKR